MRPRGQVRAPSLSRHSKWFAAGCSRCTPAVLLARHRLLPPSSDIGWPSQPGAALVAVADEHPHAALRQAHRRPAPCEPARPYSFRPSLFSDARLDLFFAADDAALVAGRQGPGAPQAIPALSACRPRQRPHWKAALTERAVRGRRSSRAASRTASPRSARSSTGTCRTSTRRPRATAPRRRRCWRRCRARCRPTAGSRPCSGRRTRSGSACWSSTPRPLKTPCAPHHLAYRLACRRSS